MRIRWWVALVLVADQVSKWYFPTTIFNQGGAFGMGTAWPWEVFSLGILCLLMGMIFKSTKAGERLGLGLIVSGGLANLIDRVFWGGVRDFIYWPVIGVYGNGADVAIVIGAGIVVWELVSKCDLSGYNQEQYL